jgi:hypothetical protein
VSGRGTSWISSRTVIWNSRKALSPLPDRCRLYVSHRQRHGSHHRRAADPPLGSGWLRADARAARRDADDGHHAVIARLITGVFKCTHPAAIVPNHDPAAVRLFSRFCNGLFVAVALNVDSNGGSIFVIMEKEAVKCHSLSPLFLVTNWSTPPWLAREQIRLVGRLALKVEARMEAPALPSFWDSRCGGVWPTTEDRN